MSSELALFELPPQHAVTVKASSRFDEPWWFWVCLCGDRSEPNWNWPEGAQRAGLYHARQA